MKKNLGIFVGIIALIMSACHPQQKARINSIHKLGTFVLLQDWPESRWAEHLQYAREVTSEGGFVETLIRLDDLNEAKWQPFFDICSRLHLTPVVRLATTYDKKNKWWTAPVPDKDGSYRTTAKRYADFLFHCQPVPAGLIYVAIGNEPNAPIEWGGQPNADQYVRFLKDVSAGLHLIPGVRVLNGAVSSYWPNAEVFVREMANVIDSVDVWNSHCYPEGPYREPPDKQTAPYYGINGYEHELKLIAELGGPSLKVMITETGWAHREAQAVNDNDAPLANQIDAQQAADYLEMAFIGNTRFAEYASKGWIPWEQDEKVIGVIPFILDGPPNDWAHFNWLKLDEQGRIQGVYLQYVRMKEMVR